MKVGTGAKKETSRKSTMPFFYTPVSSQRNKKNISCVSLVDLAELKKDKQRFPPTSLRSAHFFLSFCFFSGLRLCSPAAATAAPVAPPLP